MCIAIIPARKNSRRIKDKNIKDFHGKPIIAWIINILQSSKIFERIIVSTDSNKIAKISIDCGAEVPFKRPKHLSDDYSTTLEVMEHAIKNVNLINKNNYICCVYPTSILVNVIDLKKSLKSIQKNKFDYIFSASKHQKSVLRSFYLNNHYGVQELIKNNYKKRTQDLSETYYDAALFYWAKGSTWLSKRKIFSAKSSIVEIPAYRSQDIDTMEDWFIAEKKFLKYGEKKIFKK